jgi:cytochrome c oxidase subunit 1
LFYNMFHSAKHGEVATGNLWESRSPEWQIPSPTPLHNYAQPIQVVGEPYDYGLDDDGYIKLGQAAPLAHPAD